MWMVRAGRGGEFVDRFLEQGVVSFATIEGEVPTTITKDELLSRFATAYPEAGEASRASWASQLLRFVVELQVGDDVVCYDRESRRYVLGKITSPYEYRPNDPSTSSTSPHIRRVSWSRETSRDVLGTETRNTLGAIQTVFRIHEEAAEELLKHSVPLGSAPPAPAKPPTPIDVATNEQALELISAETFEKANEFIEDQIDALGWSQMQELVAGILRAMGYRTTVSDHGPDRGVDVFASPDGLGLEEPRIFVEVKHRTKAIESKEIRSFVGGRRKGDKCLYVSTGGFTKDAHYEAERAEVALTLVTLPRLRQLVVDFYDKLDSETRALVPLRKLFWPATKT